MAQAGKNQGGTRAKHVPQRTCVACRLTDAKRGLIRLVRVAEGRVEVDPTGKRQGRGAYLCYHLACWEQALKRHTLERALRVEQLSVENQRELLSYIRSISVAAQDAPHPDNADVGAPLHDRRADA